jgi:cellulose synthase/poly-beta-1,6-N-acetylglucosamine synthase-like glycosyltransferase
MSHSTGVPMPEPLAITILVLTVGVLAFLLPFAAHRTLLVRLTRRDRREVREALPESRLPSVTVQLPIYNELHVTERLIDAACRLDYPTGLLEVQVLDDSTDETASVAARRVREWRGRGVDVRHLRRGSREGFKAGALAFGTESAKGDFIVVLDADFVAPSDLVRRLLPPFQDPGVGVVQARWDHLNRDENWLTRGQSLLLDGHFLYEQGGRYRGDRFFNFNGTAGMWRRTCLEDAGGWQADTLTEDLDLSYRAQMRGWRFAYLDDVAVPSEIPATVSSLEIQQKRWAQGGIETARKILPGLLRGRWPIRIKAEAVIHLCGHLAHPLTLMLGLLLLPSAIARRSLGLEKYLWVDLLVFGAATVPFLYFYGTAGRRRGRPTGWTILSVLQTLAVGIGLSVAVTRSVIRGAFHSGTDPFVRTPKKGVMGRSSYGGAGVNGDLVLKLVLGAVMAGYLAVATLEGFYGSIPFILLFASGYLGLGLFELRDALGFASLAPSPPGVVNEKAPHGNPEEESCPERLRPSSGGVEGFQAPVAEEHQAAQQEPRTAYA